MTNEIQKERERCVKLTQWFFNDGPGNDTAPRDIDSLLFALCDPKVKVCPNCDGLTGGNQELEHYHQCQCQFQHPMQPLVVDSKGTVRFKKNQIVTDLLNRITTATENHITKKVIEGEYSRDDYNQLMQLVGYSVSGYGDLDLIDPNVAARASEIAEGMRGDG